MSHLFAARGDLTKLACDALLIPCDSAPNVNEVWDAVLPKGLPPSERYRGWRTLQVRPNEAGVVRLPAVDGRQVWAFSTVDIGVRATPKRVATRTLRALKYVSEQLASHGDRAAPLIGIPLPGTGHGGLQTRRAEVIERLLDGFRATLFDADVALVLFDRRDFAAVQERRALTDWAELPTNLIDHADRLGKLAARDELSLFLGAGVSKPVGLPDWRELLASLAEAAGDHAPRLEGDPYKVAEPIVRALGDKYHDALRRHLVRRTYGIGHALLASLGTSRMVTTNFDRCMEIALEEPTGSDFRVLTRQLARGGWPWLLKLNGDVADPATIVLTESDLVRYPDERQALEGVVQSLLLTSHLFFIGFSLTDENFLELAAAVSSVRSRARDSDLPGPGTALALTDDECRRAKYKDLEMLSMDSQNPTKGARRLEIFLDRLVWTAATQSKLASEYLLDERYRSGLSKHDAALRKLLVKMAGEADEKIRSSNGWRRVSELLRDLGADESGLI
ncbi:SIR2 family protein [Mycobacterium cookii]|uniref:SIR2 family protein n=1 Tax=Mycobacterium cookii TaxID=1775 RepID=UPI0013D3A899|nr:SIR2 family protein [Mycobacterium cookii]MCV7329915.1 SIR2 family protein [Mycobacterium cookii]